MFQKERYPSLKMWKPVPGFEKDYEISDQGEVRRTSPGHGARVGNVLKWYPNNAGYPRVTLGNKKYLVHVLVAAAFLGPPPEGYEVHHKDDNRGNPFLGNLEYVTRSQNLRKSKLFYERMPRGEAKPGRKLTEENVRTILASSESNRALGKRYGISNVQICLIRQRKKWRHVSYGVGQEEISFDMERDPQEDTKSGR
jgi:hypothetical protein